MRLYSQKYVSPAKLTLSAKKPAHSAIPRIMRRIYVHFLKKFW